MAKGLNLRAIFTADTKGIEKGAKRATDSIKDFDRNSKKAMDSFAGYLGVGKAKLQSFGSALGGLATRMAAFVVSFQAIGNAVKTIASFEEANSKLAAVLGTTAKGVENLSKAAMDLGKRTQFTASQVTELQTELAKLGFSEPEIISMQEATLKFAAAVGTDLASAAARAGATMRGFDLTAEDTGKMLAEMAVSTSKSALSFEYLDNTLGKLVPTTKAFGFDTRATLALLGTLANAGIDASSAYTALRKTIMELSDSESNLNKALGGQPKTMTELLDKLEQLRKKNISVSEASDLVGERAASAFLALMNGAESCRELWGELDNVESSLDAMYSTMTDNLIGAVKELQSAWEGFILKLKDSKGLLMELVRMATDTVNMISNFGNGGLKDFFHGVTDRDVTDYYSANFSGMGTNEEIDRYLKDLYRRRDEAKNQPWLEKMWRNEAAYIEDEIRIAERAAEIARQALSQRGGTSPSSPTTPNNNTPVVDPTKKRKADSSRSVEDEARAYANEAAEIAKYEAEMAEYASDLYESWKALNPQISGVKDETVILAQQVATAVDLEQKALEEADKAREESFKKSMEEQEAALQDWVDKCTEAARTIQQAFQTGIIDSLTYIAESFASGDFNAAEFARRLVDPLADAAIAAGTLIMTTGKGIEAIVQSFHDLNGWKAVAAGAALVGLGLAMKAGMAAIANGSSYTSASSASGGMSSYNSGNYTTRDITVNVTGTLVANGSQLVAVLNNENKRKSLTT